MYLENNKYEILTPSGYKPFKGIRKTNKLQYIAITLNTGKHIRCSVDHPFILDGIPILANELKRGTNIDSESDVWVDNIELINDNIELFDIIDVADDNIFIVDNIVSHNCDFLKSGRTVIDALILQKYRDDYQEDPIERRHMDGNLWIWKQPVYKSDKTYIVAADVSRGDARDYSAFHVIDVENLEQVAEYRGLISTKDFGNLCVNIAKEYNDALLIIENNNIGWAAIQQVIDREYPNLFYTSKDLKYVDVYHQLSNKINREERKMIPGFSTTSKTRPLLVAKLEEFFREETIIVHSKRLLDELFTFVYKGDRAEAMENYNDDLVMSLAIGLWIRDTALRLRAEGIALQKKTLDKMLGTGVYTSAEVNKNDSWEWDTVHGKESLTWLID